MGRKDWRDKFRQLIREASGRTAPLRIDPKRTSGPWRACDACGLPVEPGKFCQGRGQGPRPGLPAGWHTEEYQRRMCASCGLPVIGRVELKEGKWCGPCFTFRILPGRRARRGPDLPPAA